MLSHYEPLQPIQGCGAITSTRTQGRLRQPWEGPYIDPTPKGLQNEHVIDTPLCNDALALRAAATHSGLRSHHFHAHPGLASPTLGRAIYRSNPKGVAERT